MPKMCTVFFRALYFFVKSIYSQIQTLHKKEVDFTKFLLKVLKSFTEFPSCEEQRNEFADTMLWAILSNQFQANVLYDLCLTFLSTMIHDAKWRIIFNLPSCGRGIVIWAASHIHFEILNLGSEIQVFFVFTLVCPVFIHNKLNPL